MNHPQNPRWSTLFTVQICINGQLIRTIKSKNIGSGEKFQIDFFTYNKLTFCNDISLNVLQQPYISI